MVVSVPALAAFDRRRRRRRRIMRRGEIKRRAER
jgi:hypothetical protein